MFSTKVPLHDDRSKHICSVCLAALESGIQLQQQIRTNESETITTKDDVSNVIKDGKSEYEFEYLDEFKDDIESGSGGITKATRIEMVPDESIVQEDDEAPGKQLTMQLTEEEMEYLHEGLPQEAKFAFKMPTDELIAQQLIFDKFEYLEISGERCCGCAHIAPSRDALMVHAKEMHSQNYYADSSYTCPTCYQKFPTEESLAKHTRYYSYSDIFLCNVSECQKAFNFRSHMMLHLMQEHDSQAEEEFESAKKKSSRKSCVQRLAVPDAKIIRETLDFPQYRQYLLDGERCCACGLCLESIQGHIAKEHKPEHSGNPLQCTICDRTFRSQRLLILHEQDRLKLSHLYECRMCGKLFDRKFNLLKHVQNELEHPSNEKEDTRLLSDTDAAASNQQALAVPCLKDVECFCCCFRRCREEFATEAALLDHADEAHAGRRKENEIKHGAAQNIRTELMCPICLLSFETVEKVQKHRFYKMRVEKQRCHICGRKFMRKSGLTEHQEREHLDLPVRFACETCGKAFITRSTLNMHRRVHEPFKRIPCDAEGCDSVFRDERLMRRHYRNVHSKDMPYACRHCQKKFRTKEALDIHDRSHTGEKPYPCRHEGCTKRYAHGTDRLRHERSVHTGVRPHKCMVCCVSFFRKRELRIHTEKLHKDV
uniref:C2H2-type domain-containing protein n=1 Tax=Anopheles atroparvus TaxID=41427 RepID=A0A182J1M2_ANOAO